MTTNCPIFVGIFDGFSWIRCEGKGSFLTSPLMKAFGDERIGAGETRLVVDLAACTGMDSTFMGTLGGMATRISSQPGGTLEIADSGDRNRRSLEDLGLDFFMQIDPIDAPWREKMEHIRSVLQPAVHENGGRVQNAVHVLEAHQNLAQANGKNAKEFENVVKLLENELERKIKEENS